MFSGVVICGISMVTWFFEVSNRICSAVIIPHFTFRVPHFTNTRTCPQFQAQAKFVYLSTGKVFCNDNDQIT